MAEQKSVRGNALPPGGAMATTEAGQGQPLLPDTFTLRRLSEQFQERSEANCIKLNQVPLTPGQQASFVIQNVGLGDSLELLVSGSVSLVNTDTDPQDVSLSYEFPFNLFQNLLTQFNGQTVINSLSGYELLQIMAKRGKNIYQGTGASAGSPFKQETVRVDRSLAWVEGDKNITVTPGNGLCGVSKIAVAGSKTGVLTFGMYLKLPYVLQDDLLMGMLPMQNNSVYASVQITLPMLLGTTAASPLYVAEAVPATLSVSSDIKLQPTYNFWSIPLPNDPRLYGYLVSHSYMLLSQPANVLNKTGAEALAYNMPNNYYLLALLFTLRDGAGDLVDMYSGIDNPYLSYNGTARVDRRDIKTRFARQNIFYEGPVSALGQLLWDGTDIAYQTNGVNTSKWLNMYLANNPQFMTDVAAGLVVPASYAVCREQLVPANVQLV